MVSESNFNHAWSFNPGVSLFVACNSENEIQTFSKNFLQMEARLWFLLTTIQVQGITALAKNLDGVKINMAFHGNLTFQNKFDL